jgi:hypothetical protein
MRMGSDMGDLAAFQATFSDWKLIKGRKVVQVVLELPLEKADHAYKVLGGMPDPGKSVWCAVARLKNGAEASAPREEQKPASPGCVAPPARRPLDSLPLPQQAGILCQEGGFRAFLNEEFNYACETADDAADAVRERCNITSRSELGTNKKAAERFIELREQYQAWRRVVV